MSDDLERDQIDAKLTELKELDPDAHDRILATVRAMLAGEPVTCPVEGCGEVVTDVLALALHDAQAHPGG